MDRTAFFAALRSRSCPIFGTALSQGQVTTLDAILDEAERLSLPISHAAYCMATAYHEVGSALQPIRESLTYTSAARIRAVWPTRFPSNSAAMPYVRQPQKLANFVYGGRLGNSGPNDGWIFRGGGLPQTTGKVNYTKIANLIGVDLVNHPERITQPRVAVSALIDGSRHGLYTGKKLSDFLPGDYFGARAVINGDKERKEGGIKIGDKIAGYASVFEGALKAAGYTNASKPSAGSVSGLPGPDTPIPGTKPNVPPAVPPTPPVADPAPKIAPDQKLSIGQMIKAVFAAFTGKWG